MYRVGIIGTGKIGRTNVKAILATGRISITCLCNAHIEKAIHFKEELSPDARVHDDPETILQT